MEENSNIFPGGGDALMDQCTKNIPQHLSEAIHIVRMYLMNDFSAPSCTHMYLFRVNPLLRT